MYYISVVLAERQGMGRFWFNFWLCLEIFASFFFTKFLVNTLKTPPLEFIHTLKTICNNTIQVRMWVSEWVCGCTGVSVGMWHVLHVSACRAWLPRNYETTRETQPDQTRPDQTERCKGPKAVTVQGHHMCPGMQTELQSSR